MIEQPISEKERLDTLYTDIILNSFTEEARAASVVSRIISHIQEEGIPTTFSGAKFESYVSRLSELKMLSNLIQGYGLCSFQERIMFNEIDRLFPKHIDQGNSNG